MMPEHRITCTFTEKACNTTLDDEKCSLRNIGPAYVDRMCVVVTAFCNQPGLFASDLGDVHSPYLSVMCLCVFEMFQM